MVVKALQLRHTDRLEQIFKNKIVREKGVQKKQTNKKKTN